jgi:tRNA(Arg) A34 adenosine deaminase TadA
MCKEAKQIQRVRRQRVVAVVMNPSGTIIGWGYCQKKTHPLQAKFGGDTKIYLHAEIDAIANALAVTQSFRLQGCTLYVLRVKHSGYIGDAKPCPVCQSAIDRFGITRIEWSKNEHVQGKKDKKANT